MSDDRARWRIASILNRLPGACWANLVGWALRHRRLSDGWRVDSICRSDAARTGCCYCGKYRPGPQGEKP